MFKVKEARMGVWCVVWCGCLEGLECLECLVGYLSLTANLHRYLGSTGRIDHSTQLSQKNVLTDSLTTGAMKAWLACIR